jgi:hypothetical protein
MNIEHTQRLVTEIEMLKVVLNLVSRKRRQALEARALNLLIFPFYLVDCTMFKKEPLELFLAHHSTR